MTNYTVTIDEDYVIPTGTLDANQYVNFVMNMASRSYKMQYETDTADLGILAACDKYNSTVVNETPVVETTPEPTV